MKKITMILVTVCLLTISCRKATDVPIAAENPKLRSTSAESAPLEKKFVVNRYDTVLLQIVMSPALVCYSNRNGETQKPCDIFIEFTCRLSKPVNGYVSVDIQKKRILKLTDPQPQGSLNESGIVFTFAPNTTEFKYRSSFQNNSNINVDENNFSIENVNFYNKVD